jgi:hypothetical protein
VVATPWAFVVAEPTGEPLRVKLTVLLPSPAPPEFSVADRLAEPPKVPLAGDTESSVLRLTLTVVLSDELLSAVLASSCALRISASLTYSVPKAAFVGTRTWSVRDALVPLATVPRSQSTSLPETVQTPEQLPATYWTPLGACP